MILILPKITFWSISLKAPYTNVYYSIGMGMVSYINKPSFSLNPNFIVSNEMIMNQVSV